MIYSIGHGNKPIEHFLDELASFGVTYLVDVRSMPASKFHPHFNRQPLAQELSLAGVRYIFLGNELGGLPDDNACYRDGKVNYELLRRRASFCQGVERLADAQRQNLTVAVMCSESKPEECHRSKAIGEALLEQGIVMQHILSKGQTKDQLTVMNELTRGKSGADLFGEVPLLESRGKHR